MTIGWWVVLTVVGAALAIPLAIWLLHGVAGDNQDVDEDDDELHY